MMPDPLEMLRMCWPEYLQRLAARTGTVAARTGSCGGAPSLIRWARSGLMALTGPPDGVPLLPARDYVGRLAELVAGVNLLAAIGGYGPIADMRHFCERAAVLGLQRRGEVSAGGKCRMVRGRNGWMAVNLTREDDRQYLPAWIGSEPGEGDWAAIARAAKGNTVEDLVEQALVLGIPVALVPKSQTTPLQAGMPARIGRLAAGHPTPRWPAQQPLVLDFSSLWAGPLCGRLLAQVGARVIKIESVSRRDGLRCAPMNVFDRFNAGKESLVLDFRQTSSIALLRRMIMRADVVIEGSRPRAFAQLGLQPEPFFAGAPGLTWVSITAYGREGAWSNRVGFGDDVAASAGLVGWNDQETPNFIGDALADPIAGMTAAGAALASLRRGGGFLVDASMYLAARYVASAPPVSTNDARVYATDGQVKLEMDGMEEPISDPVAPPAPGRGPLLGEHSSAIMNEFG